MVMTTTTTTMTMVMMTMAMTTMTTANIISIATPVGIALVVKRWSSMANFLLFWSIVQRGEKRADLCCILAHSAEKIWVTQRRRGWWETVVAGW